ncbi:MAG: HD-GYP domain-containing protein [Candidatus Rokubacteria bacterium]|nr:HD-GYP domain-containing protein [Candidatus Rokubacteria bacterium]
MAGHVALAQALSYARDLKVLHQASRARERELAQANQRLRAAHRQTLRYAEDLKRTHGRVERVFLHSLQALAHALEARDQYTRGHSERVAALGRSLALAAGLAAPVAELLAQAARLHDLGKIGIPEVVLRKPGPLTAAEWETMREHPLTGARILAPLEFFVEGASIVRHHHERQDGSGYPDGLLGAGIPLGARIVAVVDVYDALTSDRPYRPGLSHEAALRRLQRESGRTLDGDLVTLFVGLVGDAPPARAL